MAKTATTKTPAPAKQGEAPQEPAAKVSNVPWRPITAALVVVAIYFGSSALGSLIVSLYPLLARLSQQQTAAWIGSSVTQFVYVLVVEALTVWLLYLFVSKYKVALRVLGLVRPRLKDAGLALITLPAYVATYAVLLAVATSAVPGIDVNQTQQLGFSSQQSSVGLVLTFVSLVILPPFVEELLLRGFLFTSLLKKLKPWLAAIITSIIFASAHLQFGSGAPLLWVAAIDTFTLSLFLCLLRYKTGSLWPGMGLHALKNLIAFVTLFILHLS